jgi:hypothetical protein
MRKLWTAGPFGHSWDSSIPPAVAGLADTSIDPDLTVVPTPNSAACNENVTMNLANPGMMDGASRCDGREGNTWRPACVGLLNRSSLRLLKPPLPRSE